MNSKELRAVRGKLGLTQTKLAKALRGAAKTVGGWERAYRGNDPMVLFQKLSVEHRVKH